MAKKEQVSDVELGPSEDKETTIETKTDTVTPTTELNEMQKSKLKNKLVIASGLILTAVVIGIAVPLGLRSRDRRNRGFEPVGNQRTDEEMMSNSLQFQEFKLPVSLREFSSDILSGYNTCGDLKDDIEQALNDFANIIIEEDMNNFISYDDFGYYNDRGEVMVAEGQPVMMEMAQADTFEMSSTSAADSSISSKEASSSITEDSFGTNNQHEDVDEADIVKSDGTYVYTVYGMDIVVLNTNGTEVFRLDLSETLRDDDDDDYNYVADDDNDDQGFPIVMEEGTAETVSISNLDISDTSQATQISGSDNNKNRKMRNMYHYSGSIRSLLLHENRLVAILSGYNYDYRSLSSSTTELVYIHIDLNNGALSVDNNDDKHLSTSINGEFQAARLIDSNVHIVTTAYISHWSFSRKLSRYSARYNGLDDVEYAKAALEKAETLIASYANHLIHELLIKDDTRTFELDLDTMKEKKHLNGNEDIIDFESMMNSLPPTTCQHIAKLSTYQNGKDETENFTGIEGVLNGFVRIFSFDIKSGPAKTENTSTSASFVPTGYADVYATSDMLFLGGRGWAKTDRPTPVADEADVEDLPSSDVTYVTAFQLDGTSAIPKATGVIPGYTLNQFSFDYYGGHLRVATSTSEVRVWNEQSWESKIIRESTNQIIVAQIEDSSIQIVGLLEDLGISERIFSVRFLQDRAFMVTFRQIDPFYTIDLSVPTNPVMRGELKIPGFSNYLHPVDDDYILAVGQDADNRGFQLGLQIALFEVSDLDNPKQIAKHVVEKWSSSTSQHDHYAFRYLPLSQKLILPISTGDFDGFHVFDINPPSSLSSATTNTKLEDGIVFDFAISHFDIEDEHKNGFKCYGFNYLTPRSLVFQGDVITLKGHAVLRYDLATGERLSRTDLDENLNEGDGHMCYGWYLW